MLGLLINDREEKELEYLLKRELEEILIDLDDIRIDENVKRMMMERYKVLFQLLRRVASEEDCLEYLPKRNKYQKDFHF
ncbi:hypothetical protein [Oceanobacillus halophilus]|uniref:Uncharacterized protein n=1 Tax=Oceanobacillus halophilus TaxID=930130 RepID=A0A494ZZN1_9BACI|nr:hypothetical protein [Oceanobacillus halophilus]RKQ32270.1 hypothetical protein D8M06_12870 [Oceanobacillus halophilus]